MICTTSTSSGKSLIYAIPMVASLLNDPSTRAFLLFPTKALAHDQLKNLHSFCKTAGISNVDTIVNAFDGDTKKSERDSIRDTAKVIVTNPDILHCTVLPAHEDWKEFLSGMRFIVIDEAHAYTGVFGNHVALIIRRLLRLCHLHRAQPRIVCCSATVANSVQHMATLTGVAAGEIFLVDKDGAPRGAREFGFWNPPGLTDMERKPRSEMGRKRHRRERVIYKDDFTENEEKVLMRPTTFSFSSDGDTYDGTRWIILKLSMISHSHHSMSPPSSVVVPTARLLLCSRNW